MCFHFMIGKTLLLWNWQSLHRFKLIFRCFCVCLLSTNTVHPSQFFFCYFLSFYFFICFGTQLKCLNPEKKVFPWKENGDKCYNFCNSEINLVWTSLFLKSDLSFPFICFFSTFPPEYRLLCSWEEHKRYLVLWSSLGLFSVSLFVVVFLRTPSRFTVSFSFLLLLRTNFSAH